MGVCLFGGKLVDLYNFRPHEFSCKKKPALLLAFQATVMLVLSAVTFTLLVRTLGSIGLIPNDICRGLFIPDCCWLKPGEEGRRAADGVVTWTQLSWCRKYLGKSTTLK